MTQPLERLTTALADRYRIEHELGSGGMATVYLAEDLKHARKVAVKLLRPELSAVLGAERFLNEIRVTANLQHPHILQLYDSGSADGLLFYVMPYIEGESLRDRLLRERQLAVDEAVEITRAVAGALDYAHRHGVIHRDIKPENILLHEGQPLVADFGIALAVSAAGGSRLTETGLSLGTPHYMSPEQATGDRAIDGRSDIYSLGCVAYEMLAGQPPHTGPTAQAIIAKIITEAAPRLSLARPSVPPPVEAAIQKAIEKLHADRWHSAAQFADALTRPMTADMAAVPVTRTATAAPAPRPVSRMDSRVAAGIAVAGLALGALAGRSSLSAPPAGGVERFAIEVSPWTTLINAFTPEVAISRDGARLAFVGRGERGMQIFVRALADSIPRPVAGTEGGSGPFFSPDGRQIGFLQASRLLRVPVEGGAPTLIADSAGPFGAVWGSNGAVVYGDALYQTLMMVTPDGARRTILRPDSARVLGLSMLPGGRDVLAVLLAGGRSRTTVVAVSLRDGRMRDIGLPNAAMVKYVPNGYVVYQPRAGGPLLAAPFNTRRLRVTGPPQAIAPEARIGFRVIPIWDVSDQGSIVYERPQPFQLVVVDRSGRSTTLRDDARTYHHPRFSPDGRRLVFDITDADARDVWILDVHDRTMTRLTVGENANDPFWSPDGRRIAYTAARGAIRGVFVRDADGSGVPDSVLLDSHDRSSGSWAPDGRTLVSGTGLLAGLWMVPLSPRGAAQSLSGSRASESHAAISPDGRWLAYVSTESGRPEVYVRPFPGPGGRRQVSTDGGAEPVWARNGRELFYRQAAGINSELIAVAVRTSPTFDIVARTPLFDVSSYVEVEDHPNYDVSPDGAHFVMVRSPQASQLHLIQNWPAQLHSGSGSN
jgi:eukaryotic-like serine/threonine-protein kinase